MQGQTQVASWQSQEEQGTAAEQGQSSSLVEREHIRQFQRDSDRVSRQIGEKLLQGWTLLDMNCPNSQVCLRFVKVI